MARTIIIKDYSNEHKPATAAEIARQQARHDMNRRNNLKVLIVALLFLLIIASFTAAAIYVREILDYLFGGSVNTELHNPKLAHMLRWCPQDCPESVMRMRHFYNLAGHAESETYLPTCNKATATDKDNGVAYRACLKKLTQDMNDPAFDRTILLSIFNLNATVNCTGGAGTFNAIELLSACPLDALQKRQAAPLYYENDMVCMRPGGMVAGIHVGSRESAAGRETCMMCESACAGDWRQWECCDGLCANLQTDARNCGSCGTICEHDTEQCANGKCLPIMWDTCNCGKIGFRCNDTQMCFESECLDPLTSTDSDFAKNHLKCIDGERAHPPSGQYSFTTMEVVDNTLQKRKLFTVLDSKHSALSLHVKGRGTENDAVPSPTPTARTGILW